MDLPNIHIYHYADMKRDLCGHIQGVADTLGVAVTDSQLEDLTAFEHKMRELLTEEQIAWLVRG